MTAAKTKQSHLQEILKRELDKFIPQMSKIYFDDIQRVWNQRVKELGDMTEVLSVTEQHERRMRRRKNQETDLELRIRYWEKVFRWDGGKGKYIGHERATYSYPPKPEKMFLKTDLLKKDADEYGQRVVRSWKQKITEKLMHVDELECTYLTGYSFTFYGQRDGHRIELRQDMILNHSVKGTLFNQFPARIYVDSKFTPAATYKKMFNDKVST